MIKSILVPTDFSDTATNAVHYAAAWGKDHNLKLHLLHAMHVPLIDANAPITLADTMMKTERSKTTVQLKQLAAKLVERYGVQVSIHADFGLGSDSIIEKSTELDVDTVVMGTSGQSGFMQALLGSVTAAVVGSTLVPILAVPKDAVYRGFNVAVFGNDKVEPLVKELEKTYKLLRKHEARLDVVSVEQGRDEYAQKIICEEGGIREVSVWASTVAEGLKIYINNEDASLLILKHRDRNFIKELFHKSTTKELLKESSIPLYIYN